MKTNEKTIGLMLGSGNETAKDLCRSLAKNGVSAIVIPKDGSVVTDVETARQWSGQPGEDLFFNGWKLLF